MSPSFIHDISPTDKSLLHKTLQHWRPHSKSYEDSWGYIIQAIRYGGFRWYDPYTKSLLFFGKKTETDSTLVIPTFFAKPDYLAKVVNKMQDTLKVSHTILKNINPDEVSKFATYGFRQYKKNEQWNSFAQFDDQTYPQLLVDLKSVVKQEGRAYHLLRKALHKKSYAYIRPYRDSDRENVLKVFAAKDGTITKPFVKKTKGMYYESHAMYPDADLYKYVIVDDATDEIVGFTAFSEIISTTAAFVASLFKPDIGVASMWGAYHTLLEMYNKGFKQVNFGGNETEGPYVFVQRTFRPVEEMAKTHLIYEI